MSDETTFEIVFKGDQAFINAMSGKAQPVPTSRPVEGKPGATERVPAYEVGGRLADKVNREGGGGESRAKEEIKKRLDEFMKYQEAVEDLINGDAFRPIGAPKKAQAAAQAKAKPPAGASAAAGEAASAEGGAAAAAGEAGAAGGAAGMSGAAVAGGVAAGFIVVGLAIIAAMKKNAEALNAQTDKLADQSPSMAAQKDLLELRRELAAYRRGEELAPQMAKWNNDKGKLEEAQTKLMTELLKLALDAWELTKGAWEILHDFIKEMVAWIAWTRSVVNPLIGDPAKQAELDASAARARNEADKAWRTDDLGGADHLDDEANKMAEQLLGSFGMGGGSKPPKIPPRREF